MSLQDFAEFDSDFGIPDVNETPTLEEILNQKDDTFNLEDILDKQDLELIEAEKDLNEIDFWSKLRNASSKEINFNLSELTYVRSQLSQSKDEKINSGNPICLVVSKNLIVIGTFNGFILVFDSSKKLKFFLKNEVDFGSIASMSINQDETKLISGGSKGAIALWSLTNGELLRLLAEDLHAPFSSIINLKYLSDSNLAILSDTSGSVFLLDTRKKNFDSQCIFSGSRGEVLSLHPLILDSQSLPHFRGLESLGLIAMATVSKVIVISVRPGVFVHFTCPLKARSDYLPVLCWNFFFKQQNTIVPLLAFGRQNQLFINKMVTDFVEKIEFLPLFQFNTSDYFFQNVCWINSSTLAITDTFENIHLVDVLAQDEMESLDISHVKLVYETAHYKSLACGGYVSPAMARAGDHACINSFSIRFDTDRYKLFILGLDSVYEMTIRTWQEKIDYLIESEEIFAALQMIHQKYLLFKTGQYSDDEMKISDKFEYVFDCFENFIFTHNCLSCQNETQLRQLITICLEYCICLHTALERILTLFERFSSNSIARGVYIECLEKYIFNGQLSDLNPILVKEIIEYYIEKKWYNLLDSLIVNFNIISLDIDFIMRVFADYRLFDSYIYICNKAFDDFLGPFDRLLKMLDQCSKEKQHSDQEILIGNKLLVYLNCMLTCVYYPNKGSIEAEQQMKHLNSIYSHLTSTKTLTPLNILLKYDCTEFLNVILFAFDYLDKNLPELSFWKQTLIDAVMNIFDECCGDQSILEQKSSFYIFLARCLIGSNSVRVSNASFDQMIDCLFAPDLKRFEERQQILIQLLTDDNFSTNLDLAVFMENATKSQMFKICEHIHRSNRNWIELFHVYTCDVTKKAEIFEFILSMLGQEQNWNSQKEKDNFLAVVFENYSFLFEQDSQKAITLFYSYFDHHEDLFKMIVDRLKPQPKLFYRFLNSTILENRSNYSKSSIYANEPNCKIFNLSLDGHLQEEFIELACQFEPEQIVSHLEILQEYNQIKVLKIFHNHNLKNGEAYLHEKTGQYWKSFEILFEDLTSNVDDLIKTLLIDLVGGSIANHSFDQVSRKFATLLEFLVRCSDYTLEAEQKEKFWFRSLDFLIQLKLTLNNIRRLSDQRYLAQYLNLFSDEKMKMKLEELVQYLSEQFKSLFEKLVNNMLGHFNLVSFSNIIISNVLQQNEDMFDIREMLLCILENYNYEKTLLEATNNILSGEYHSLTNHLRKANTKSRNIKQLYCHLCLRSCRGDNRYVLYECDHLFHSQCLDLVNRDENRHCPVCAGSSTVDLLHPDDLDDRRSPATPPTITKLAQLNLNESQLRALSYFHCKKV